MRTDQDVYDRQDYPEMPASQEVYIHIEDAMAHRAAGTLTLAEIVAAILDYVETLDPSLRVEVRREHQAILAHHAGQGHQADYARLKADLERNSAVTHWLLDRMRDDATSRD